MYRSGSLHKIVLISFLLVLFFIGGKAAMPDNYLHISDESFRLYNIGMLDKAHAALYADSMTMHAKQTGEKRPLVLAEYLRLRYYSYMGDSAKCHGQLMKMRSLAKQMGIERDYYLSYNLLAEFYAGNGRYKDAIDTVEELLAEATKANSKFGLWHSYNSYAHLYDKMKASDLVIKYANKAIEIGKDIDPPVSVSSDYILLSNYSPDLQEKEKYATMALEHSVVFSDSIRAYNILLNIYSHKRDTASFESLYKVLTAPQMYKRQTKLNIINLQVKYHYFYKRYEEAIQLLLEGQKRAAGTAILFNLEHTYVNLGRYKEAYETRLKYDSITRRENLVDVRSTLRQFNLNDVKNTLTNTKSKQQLQRQQEEAELAAVEARQAEAKAKELAERNRKQKQLALLARDSASHKALMLENERQASIAEKAALELKQAELLTDLEENRRQAERSRSGIIISSILALLALIALLIIGYATISRRNHTLKMRRLNKQLAAAINDAQEASRKKDLFLQNMSHELRTPLNAVMGLSQILTCGVPVSDEEKLEYGHDINNNVKMLQMLIDDILNVSDIQAGTYSVSLRKSDIATICHDAMALAQYRVPGGVELRYENELPEGYECVIDSKRAQQVIVNYLTNACKHTREGSIVVRSTINDHPGFVTFSVTDTGEGIPPDQAHNIFERFTKLNDFVQGTGLGLNICYTIALMLHGRVWLDTSYTQGARFYFEVPTNLKENTSADNTL